MLINLNKDQCKIIILKHRKNFAIEIKLFIVKTRSTFGTNILKIP